MAGGTPVGVPRAILEAKFPQGWVVLVYSGRHWLVANFPDTALNYNQVIMIN